MSFSELLSRLECIAADLHIKVLETTGDTQTETSLDLEALLYTIDFLRERGEDNV